VETETGALSTTVENRQVTSLPLLGRDPQAFRLVAPGVVNGANGPVTQGGLVRKDPYYIDGVNSSSHVWSGNPVNPNPDVIQEFKTLTNSFSAEYGEASGAVQPSTAASGRQVFANQIFDPLTAAPVGNSVVREPFPGNIIPASRLNPVALKVQDLYPAAQIDTPFANFSTFGTNPVNTYEYDIKIDHNFSSADKISGRFSRRQNDQDQPTAFGRIAGGPVPGTLGPGFSH